MKFEATKTVEEMKTKFKGRYKLDSKQTLSSQFQLS